MKQNPYIKRSRNRNRRPMGAKGGHSPNRVFESNGPGVKMRGTAAQLHEKYLGLARDAQSGGDRVAAEGFFQHAEHYQRVLSSFQEQSDAHVARNEGGHKHAHGQAHGDGSHKDRQHKDGAHRSEDGGRHRPENMNGRDDTPSAEEAAVSEPPAGEAAVLEPPAGEATVLEASEKDSPSPEGKSSKTKRARRNSKAKPAPQAD